MVTPLPSAHATGAITTWWDHMWGIGANSKRTQNAVNQACIPMPGAQPGLPSPPGCPGSHATGMNNAISAFTNAIDSAQGVVSWVAEQIFMILAPLSVLIFGVKFAFGVEQSAVVPLSRLFLVLTISWVFVQVGPAISSAILEQFQTWGTAVGPNLLAGAKAQLLTTSVGYFSNSLVNAIVPSQIALDPWSIVKTGIQDASLILVQAIPVLPKSLTAIVVDAAQMTGMLPTLFLYLISALVTLVMFLIIGVDAILIIFEIHTYILFASIAASFGALHGARMPGAGIHKVMEIVIQQSMRVFTFYLALPIVLLAQAGFLATISGYWGPWSAITLIAMSVIALAMYKSIMGASGKIFGHSGMSGLGGKMADIGMAAGAAVAGAGVGGAAMGLAKGVGGAISHAASGNTEKAAKSLFSGAGGHGAVHGAAHGLGGALNGNKSMFKGLKGGAGHVSGMHKDKESNSIPSTEFPPDGETYAEKNVDSSPSQNSGPGTNNPQQAAESPSMIINPQTNKGFTSSDLNPGTESSGSTPQNSSPAPQQVQKQDDRPQQSNQQQNKSAFSEVKKTFSEINNSFSAGHSPSRGNTSGNNPNKK